MRESAMALEPSLWRTLPEELLDLVFARLPAVGIGQLRVLSKEWKRNIDCKHSAFNRVLDATARLQKFALMSWPEEGRNNKYGETLVELYDVRDDVQTNKRVFFKSDTDYVPFFRSSTADGGLFCRLEYLCDLNANLKLELQIIVVNPLMQRKRILPPLLSMGFEERCYWVKMIHLTMDKKTKEYTLHVVAATLPGNNLFAQVYDSKIHGWSVVEPRREGRIFGWNFCASKKWETRPCVYNCADGNLFCFNPPNIAPRLTLDSNCIELLNDHVFVFHQKEPPSSRNSVHEDENTLTRYCISEFHLPEKATTWEKLQVHECDPSMYHNLRENYEWSLLSCNGFLLVRMKDIMSTPKYETMWLYNLSTCEWCHLKELITPVPYRMRMMLSEISWSALP